MRLLFLSNFYPPVSFGGYELNCSDVTHHLRSRGHDIVVLTSDWRTEASDDEILRLLHLRTERRRTFVSTVLAQRRNVQILRNVVAQRRPDAIVFWNGRLLGHGIFSAAERLCPVVYYLQDPWLIPLAGERRGGPGATKQRLYDALLRASGVPIDAIRTDRLIFCSRALRDTYAERGVRSEHTVVIHSGLSLQDFPYYESHLLRRASGDPTRLLYVGRLVPAKGIDTLIAALSTVRASPGFGNTTLTLVGSAEDAHYEATLRARVASLQLTDAVSICPHRPRAEIVAAFAQHDVFVFPSEWNEPFGLALVEAMASGIPIVSIAHGGPGEIVEHDRTAYTFAAGDPEGLARALVRVLSDPHRAAQMGAEASRDARRRFTIERQVDETEQYLLTLAAKSR